jgi:SsrA-binding protein
MTTFVENKKIRLDYEIMESYEAGIELLGFEVKSLRAHTASLLGSYVIIRGGEAFLVGAHIPPFQEKNTPTSYDPNRNRRLLLRKNEIAELANLKKGLTVVPISVYSKGGEKRVVNGKNVKSKNSSEITTGGKIKIDIAIVRGKKKYDKRETLKKRASERDIAREFAL